MDDITFIIQTFKRPKCLERLTGSIKQFYPDIPILVYDDGDSDMGLSWGRNHLVSQVQTEYFLLLDDDFVFTEKTDIGKLLKKAKMGYDVVAGCLSQPNGSMHHYEGRYEFKDNVIRFIKCREEPFDFVLNFFVGRTDTFRRIKWDDQQKLAEHTAFFFVNRGKLKIGYLEEVVVKHMQERPGDYAKYRDRSMAFYLSWMKKHGIEKVIGYNGETYQS
jgi:glycosyltransferase involved in cell wall biosynthesis